MKLDFVINKNYLIVHTLSCVGQNKFSSNKHKKDIVVFQNIAWEKSEGCYDFLTGRVAPDGWIDENIKTIAKNIPEFLKVIVILA